MKHKEPTMEVFLFQFHTLLFGKHAMPRGRHAVLWLIWFHQYCTSKKLLLLQDEEAVDMGLYMSKSLYRQAQSDRHSCYWWKHPKLSVQTLTKTKHSSSNLIEYFCTFLFFSLTAHDSTIYKKRCNLFLNYSQIYTWFLVSASGLQICSCKSPATLFSTQVNFWLHSGCCISLFGLPHKGIRTFSHCNRKT